MSVASDSDEVGEQIRVCLTLAPEVTDRSLEITSDPIAVPAAVGRKGLTAVINHLLGRRVKPDDEDDESSSDDGDSDDDEEEDDKLPAIPFDFALKDNNRLLRSGVEGEARRYGLSLETPLAIVYFPAQEAPELEGETETLPDWVSGLSYVMAGSDRKSDAYLCAASYDGSLRIYQPLQEHHEEKAVVLTPIASTASAHTGPIKCMSAMMDSTNQNMVIASGSMDHTLAVHSFQPRSKNLFKQIHCRRGHAAALSSVDLFPPNETLASGDWDGTLCLWDLTAAAESEEQATKKAKTETKDASSTQNTTKILNPKMVLPRAHANNISGISWGNLHKHSSNGPKTLITGSWDHTVKLWDMDRQECVLALNGSRVVACLDTSHHSEGIVATGHHDCAIRLWDVRKDQAASAVTDKTFRPSHKSWVTAVQWSPKNPYHLASTSHDASVKVWDIRASLPLYTVQIFPKTEKGLCLAYGQHSDGTNSRASLFLGGTECIVKHFTTNG